MSAMATIKTSCPLCGDVDLRSSEVTLTICSHKEWSYYSFTCPGCGEVIDKSANAQVIAMLTGGGVFSRHWHVPAEVFEPRALSPLTHDELLDFHAALESLETLPDEVL